MTPPRLRGPPRRPAARRRNARIARRHRQRRASRSGPGLALSQFHAHHHLHPHCRWRARARRSISRSTTCARKRTPSASTSSSLSGRRWASARARARAWQLPFVRHPATCKEKKKPQLLPAPPPQAAALLGYPTWAAYAQETLMAKNPQRVDAFLTDLRGRLLQVRCCAWECMASAHGLARPSAERGPRAEH